MKREDSSSQNDLARLVEPTVSCCDLHCTFKWGDPLDYIQKVEAKATDHRAMGQ